MQVVKGEVRELPSDYVFVLGHVPGYHSHSQLRIVVVTLGAGADEPFRLKYLIALHQFQRLRRLRALVVEFDPKFAFVEADFDQRLHD